MIDEELEEQAIDNLLGLHNNQITSEEAIVLLKLNERRSL